MPAWGAYRGPYGDVLARVAVAERHATDIVNAINYDYRAADTLGEEFILFAAALGVGMLLRSEPGGDTVKSGGRLNDAPKLSIAVRALNLPALIVTTVVGVYIGTHGASTPGGGFQGGVILATAPLMMYICENTRAFQRVTSNAATEIFEAAGAGTYAAVGIVSLLMGCAFLGNFMPLGTPGDVFSGGTIAFISIGVGVEVTASFLLVLYTYLEEIIHGEVAG